MFTLSFFQLLSIFILVRNISCSELDIPHGKFLYEDLRCTTKDGNSYECNVVAKDHCIFEGRQFGIGEKISDAGLTANCFVNCTCLEGGTIKCDEDFCTSKIEIAYPECNYRYLTDVCCPVQFCDQKQQIVKLSHNSSKSYLHCDFGDDTVPYGYGFNTTVKSDYDTYKAVCECKLPPFLTCLNYE